ncbi:MAG: hypothetical protein KAV82_00370 [Phycisphaerae bacterium]|nr:hypothetical protein [Phycisphaerae bacterium]
MAGFRRIPTLEITDAAEQQISQLCDRLGINDPRVLIDRALKALVIMAEVAGEEGNEVDISNAQTPETVRRVRIRS